MFKKIFKKIDKVHILILLGLCFVFLTSIALAPDGVSRFDSMFIGAEDDTAGNTIAVGGKQAFIKGTLEVDGTAYLDGAVEFGSTLKFGGVAYTMPTGAGTNTYVLTTDGTSTLTWGAAGTAPPYNNIADPTADSSITFANDEILAMDFSDINEDMFTIQGIGGFANVSIVKIEQKTGAASDGTVLTVVAADDDVDPLVVSASNTASALVVGQNTGVVTIAGVAEGTTALEVVLGDILISGGDLHVVKDATFDEDVTITGTASIGTIAMDAVVAATSTQTLTLDGETSGGVTIGATSEGNITLGDTVIVSDGFNMTIGEGTLTIDNDAVDEWGLVITADATTTTGALQIVSKVSTAAAAMAAVSITADDITTGDVLLLDSLAAGMTTGNFINAFDGSGTVFEVGLYGATTIAGNASTDIIIVSAGDIQLTNGDIDLDQGNLMVDTTQDLGHNISRNYAGAGGTPCLTITDLNGSSTNAALSVVQGGTTGSEAILITHSGDGAAIEIVAGAARTGPVIDIAMANQEAQNALFIDGAWTGASDVGAIEINTTGNIASGGSMIRLDYDTGTPAGTGFAIEIDDDSGAGSTYYALLINSANNEGIHVELGTSLFVETTTFTAQSVHTGGIDANDPVDIDMDAANETVDITATADSYTAKSGVLMVEHTDGTLTNQQYLLKLQYTDDDNANADFILCIDDSASNKDELFAVDSDGAIVGAATLTLAGSATINGAALIGDGLTTQYGFVAVATDGGAGPVSVEIVNSGTVYWNSEACQFNLPAAAAGLRYTFVVADNSLIEIEPDNVDKIIHLGIDAGDKISSTTIGDTITLIAVGAVNWYVESVYPLAADWADGGA